MPALGLGRVDLVLDPDALGALGERLGHHGFAVRDDGQALRSTTRGTTCWSRPSADSGSDRVADDQFGLEDRDVPRVTAGEQVEQDRSIRSPCVNEGCFIVVSAGVTDVATGESRIR